MTDKFVVSTNEIGGMMSDCDNCIYLDQDPNGEYCHKGHTGHKTLIHNCCDFEHWNTLTPEERRPQCND